MSLPFTNTHMHVFNTSCAPDRFLMIVPNSFLRKHPITVKKIIDTKPGRWVIEGLFKLFNLNDKISKEKFARYLAFLDIGTGTTQQEVFEIGFRVAQQSDPSARMVGLTMNMDYMDSQSSNNMIKYETQLDQVITLKRFYPTNFFPFLGIDPRHRSGTDLVDWARPYFETGVERNGTVYPNFCGIKLYPALGFFPFDPRLEELYAYAQEKNIPVMTHCTRSGSQYIGNQIESLIPKYPQAIQPDRPVRPQYANWQKEINDRIDRYYKEPGPDGKGRWIKNSDIGSNDFACDLFGHPQNYIPVLEKFPALKICLAHMGGSDEIPNPPIDPLLKIIQGQTADGWNWFQKIQEMMVAYPNMYTDISYTLSDLANTKRPVLNEIEAFLKTGNLSERVLFGTDFFMTEQEKDESELYANAQKTLTTWVDQIARINPQQYLMQP